MTKKLKGIFNEKEGVFIRDLMSRNTDQQKGESFNPVQKQKLNRWFGKAKQFTMAFSSAFNTTQPLVLAKKLHRHFNLDQLYGLWISLTNTPPESPYK